MNIPVKRLYPDSVLPTRKPGDAGFDLYLHRRLDQDDEKSRVSSCHVSTVNTSMQERYYSGVAVAIPAGHVGLLLMRSSVSNTPVRFENAVGVIDASYRGEIYAVTTPGVGNGSMSGALALLMGLAMDLPASPLLNRITEILQNSHNEHVKEILASECAVGERFAQLVILPLPEMEVQEVEKLDITSRGTGGYGSTGK